MPFAAALSEHPVAPTAIGEVLGEVMELLGTAPDLAVLFATANHTGAMEDMAAAVQTILDPSAFIGATAGAVLAGPHGVEAAPGVVLWAATLPAPVMPFHLEAVPDDPEDPIEVLADARADGTSEDPAALLVLADPFSFSVTDLLARFSRSHPDLRVVGGLASAAQGRGGNRLIIGGRVTDRGAVGLRMGAGVELETVVSQGCRPIGQPFAVTRADGHLVYELGGRPALERLMDTITALGSHERSLAAQGLHCGVVVDERAGEFERGDFLIRGVLGADKTNGVVAIGGAVPVGSIVQFQVRDAVTAGEDLELLLDRREAEAALVFTCNGRGRQMFGDPHHDAAIVTAHVPGAVAGMFCAGEIGPVAGRNALHGFTASVALFRDR